MRKSLIVKNFRISDSDGIQTHDLQNRNLTLYSAKLRNQFECKGNKNFG